MIVVDASALLEVLLQTPAAGSIQRRIFRAGEDLVAPHLIDLEVASVLRRYVASGQIGGSRAADAIEDLTDFPLKRYPHLFLLERVWELRGNVTAYDAVYLALAEILNAPLITRDRRLASAPGHRARIHVL